MQTITSNVLTFERHRLVQRPHYWQPATGYQRLSMNYGSRHDNPLS